MGLDDIVAKTAYMNGKVEKEKELDPSALFLELTKLPRPSREIPFPRNIPGTNKPVGTLIMWPLSQEEQAAANAGADRYTKELFKDPQREGEANLGYQHVFQNDIAVQILHLACRDVNDPVNRPAFPSTKRMRAHLTTDEIGVLFANYCTVQAELGPIRSQMSKEEEDALILRIVEGASTFPLDGLSWEAQRALLMRMGSRLLNCFMVITSLGGHADVSGFVLDVLRERAAKAEGEADSDAHTTDEILDESKATDED